MGMWSLHPFRSTFPELAWTSGLAFRVSQFYAGRLLNSYYDRAYTAGIERLWFRDGVGPFQYALGYRIGLVTGYDYRLMDLANETPILPYGGVLGSLSISSFEVDVFYVYKAISLEVGFNLP